MEDTGTTVSVDHTQLQPLWGVDSHSSKRAAGETVGKTRHRGRGEGLSTGGMEDTGDKVAAQPVKGCHRDKVARGLGWTTLEDVGTGSWPVEGSESLPGQCFLTLPEGGPFYFGFVLPVLVHHVLVTVLSHDLGIDPFTACFSTRLGRSSMTPGTGNEEANDVSQQARDPRRMEEACCVHQR